MITSFPSFSTKEQLEEIANSTPYLVSAIGYLVHNGETSEFSSSIDSIPYKGYLVVRHKGQTYQIRKRTDGGYSVE